ncbi:Rieske (2Fe-2S) protein [Corynebacterium sp. sy017]|uniref:Rieske (2Fe-2S) protein n=1 Tax=unclassified Corynebacterium TaxID=2624378 RepID=UPI001186F425|nr:MULTISPECIES: Rieske (2Fe-2S) protein [unclassified Corynebacterium]MBP3088247.1 Rieske (2Fe-2S) protein [Corynebacterium sp. sy017]QDZ43430.1 Rieske (2Fe-2S) protein [Corynebacterium sp. sy039]TSD91576.1 Rieske (2Fe-2S) protein [Corynebacterium sp. SY003]
MSTHSQKSATVCSRRSFLLGTATTFAGALALSGCSQGSGGSGSASVSVQDVPVGSAIIVDKFIIAQPTKGEYKAYSAICPHANGIITMVNGNTVRCPKHGSEFNIADGSVSSGPSRAPLTAATLKNEGEKLSAS